MTRKAPRLAPYWYVIIFLLLVSAALYVYHLLTGFTPDRVAFAIPLLDFAVYWYGLWIVGGIALGAYVVASLAQERAEQEFVAHVPAAVYQRPLTDLGLPEPIEAKVARQKIDTVGEVLFRWGLDPRQLGVKQQERATIETHLADVPQVDAAWLHDAPWRVWNPDHVWNGIIWCLVLGLIGARLYHVLTPSPSMAAVGIESPLDYLRNPSQLLNFRGGGLGIYGGIAGGALGLFFYARRARIPALAWADLAVVGLALGQVFGRWGNFFNQELYGRPTNLPWAVYIEPAYRLPAYRDFATFHPAFLYESLWSLLAFLVLYTLARRYGDRLLTGELMALYLVFYAVGRSLLELVRLDSRMVQLGFVHLNLAVATLVSIAVALAAALGVALRRWRRRRVVAAA